MIARLRKQALTVYRRGFFLFTLLAKGMKQWQMFFCKASIRLGGRVIRYNNEEEIQGTPCLAPLL